LIALKLAVRIATIFNSDNAKSAANFWPHSAFRMIFNDFSHGSTASGAGIWYDQIDRTIGRSDRPASSFYSLLTAIAEAERLLDQFDR